MLTYFKQSQMERAIREKRYSCYRYIKSNLFKRAAESELEQLTIHIPTDTQRLHIVLEDLTSRLRNVQNERSEAVQRLERYIYFFRLFIYHIW